MENENILNLSETAPPSDLPSTKEKKLSSRKRNKLIFDIIAYVILIAGSFVMLYPLYWMVMASFSEKATMLQITFVPLKWDFTNYGKVFSALGSPYGPGYIRAVLNTLLYSIPPVIVGTIVSAGAAFAFSKIDFKGKNFIFMFLLAAIMVPFPSIMMQQFYLYSKLKWISNPMAMIIPKMFGSILTVFFIRQFLSGLPTSIIESSKIDGASYPRIFFQMILPLAGPAVFAHGLTSFIGSWNDYLAPLLFVREINWYPITIALAKYNSGLHAQGQIVMAGSVLALIPVLALFSVFQKQIIQSVMLSGSKE